MEEKIISILGKHERTTYPNGVGSVERSIKSSEYHSIAQEIVALFKKSEQNLNK